MTDLFDVLDIGRREGSYTSLLAALFDEKPKWAREFFRQSTGAKDLPPKPVGVHRRPETSVSDRTVTPDLVLTFGDPAVEVWVVEARLEAGVGDERVSILESDEAHAGLAEGLGLPEDARWHHSYLTLEGEEPAGAQEFRPATFEPLTGIFTKKPSLPDEVYPAYNALRKRLRDYYKASRREPDPDSTLGEYLEDDGGLVSGRARFYWLGERLADELKLSPKLGTTGGRRPVPLCQMRDANWQGPRYVKASETPLKDCHDVHLELQLYEESAVLLHYETNPYMPRLGSLPDNVTRKQYDDYRERRKQFAQALAQHGEALREAGWRLSTGGVNQLARLDSPLPPETTVGEARKTLRDSAGAMRSAVNDSLDER